MLGIIKRTVSLLLTLCIVFTAAVAVVAEEEGQETYLSDIRVIYAKNKAEAEQKLAETAFEGYTVLDADLNSGTGEKGAYLCYKTTTDIEDAITDITAMFMDGGYHEGNYREMVAASRAEYEAMSKIYLQAVEHFCQAYEAGDPMAESAYRQMNLYVDPDSGERIGDLFTGNVDAGQLATVFMEGNVHVLKNLRVLLAQGTAYNESGLTYTETVEEMAALFEEDPLAFEEFDNYSEFDVLALLVASGITTFGTMLREYEAVEAELNWADEEITDSELQYLEHAAIAGLFREVAYTDGVTLYDFCLSYTVDEDALQVLYPLVAALNPGQAALTHMCRYYDVVCYSVTDIPADILDGEISALEEKYGDEPFDIYEGVDRSIFEDTYALTNEAYRADAYNESGFTDFFTIGNIARTALEGVVFCAGLATLSYSIYRMAHSGSGEVAAAGAAYDMTQMTAEALKASRVSFGAKFQALPCAPSLGVNPAIYTNNSALLDRLLEIGSPNVDTTGWGFVEKMDWLDDMVSGEAVRLEPAEMGYFNQLKQSFKDAHEAMLSNSKTAAETAAKTASYSGLATGLLFFAGGVAMLVSAFSFYMNLKSYYNPDYSDVPVALVDMRDTEDGDRYVKYDAVFEAEERAEGEYIPADTNVYEAQRWICLYYTKSYEAGRPLLSEFVLSHNNQHAAEGYAPVHLFGEEVCYNLNRYNFDSDSDSIYLTVRQSENNKAAVAEVPEVVGTMIGGGYIFLGAGLGLLVGAGVSVGVSTAKKKKAAH